MSGVIPKTREAWRQRVILGWAAFLYVGCAGSSTDKASKAADTPGAVMSPAGHGVDHISVDGDKNVLLARNSQNQLIATPATGELKPLAQTSELVESDFEEDSLAVATVKATASFGDLYLEADKEDTLFLYKNKSGGGGNDWSATILQSTGTFSPALTVRRFVYRDKPGNSLPPGEYPNTARFDTLDNQQVIGVRCGDGWCMVGKSLLSLNDHQDPEDHHDVDTRRRIRGWSDRQDRKTANGKSYSIYPVSGLGQKTMSNYADKYDQVATIRAADNSDSSIVWLTHDTKSDKWKFLFKNGPHADTVAMTKPRMRHRDRRVPGSARWDVSDAQQSAKFVDLGVMWVRCANGCCSIEAEIPM